MSILTCYNKGCSGKFNSEENSEDACQHHPGGPVFHDAYKGWSCCKKRSIDFTEFLNIPGCTKGPHNPTKPKEPEKKVEKLLDVGEVIESVPKMMKHKSPAPPAVRPSDDIPKIKLTSKIASSLKSALERHKQKEQNIANGEIRDELQVGASCKHNSCNSKYQGEESNSSDCTYHPGYPVFHEGYKFWSCCKKRTSDFNEFLKQSGCETGEHEWLKPSEAAEKKSTCRYDWHQTGANILISVYAKVCDPEKSIVEANPTGVHLRLAFNGGIDVFEIDIALHGIINPELSSVEYMGTKAEIKLRKKEAFSWPRLYYIIQKEVNSRDME